MKKLIILLSAALVSTVACRDRARDVGEKDIEMRKPVETTIEEPAERAPEPVPPPAAPAPTETVEPTVSADDDFIQTRMNYQTTVRERLNRLDAKLDQLEDRVDAASRDAAARLRATWDQLASRINTIGEQAETGWDRFQSEMSRTFDQLEREVDDALK